MDSYNTPLWDLSQATSFAQLPDDDFLAMLQKQFPNTLGESFTGAFETNSINPQNLSGFPPGITPPSEDSSPSPPSATESRDNDSPIAATEQALKRKASEDEDVEEGPSQKSQHTAANNKKGSSTTTKRKTSGAGGPDESRLMKRKEQNRAAQRAFRERKEKHVKDLEDKVAALEAKNEQAASENENLRDLLTRLQTENMNLKQSQQQSLQQTTFTFSVPKNAQPENNGNPSYSMGPFTSDATMFSSLPRTTYQTPTLTSPNTTNPLDWSSLTSFDPNMLSLLDEQPQQTATGDAMQMDLGYTPDGGHFSNNFKIIASNPSFLSLASLFDSNTPPAQPPASNEPSPFHFDMSSLTPWPQSHDSTSLDDLFGGFMGGTADFSTFMTPTVSPIVHHDKLNANNFSSASRSPNTSSSSSPASQGSDPSLFSVTHESSSSASESDADAGKESGECPRSRKEFVERMDQEGQSAFAPSCSLPSGSGLGASLMRKNDSLIQSVTCQGSSSFPPTEKSERNVEVLNAWRQITSDPTFKDVDINQLCSDFSSKARCDGQKVVLEPDGVSAILETMHAVARS